MYYVTIALVVLVATIVVTVVVATTMPRVVDAMKPSSNPNKSNRSKNNHVQKNRVGHHKSPSGATTIAISIIGFSIIHRGTGPLGMKREASYDLGSRQSSCASIVCTRCARRACRNFSAHKRWNDQFRFRKLKKRCMGIFSPNFSIFLAEYRSRQNDIENTSRMYRERVYSKNVSRMR